MREQIATISGVGRLFRAWGADGEKIPKVLGNISLLFTRATVPLEKLESLLGRGRHEQFFQAIGKEFIKFKNIDVASAINRNLNAMQIFERKLKEQAVSGRDLFKIITAVTKKGLDLSICLLYTSPSPRD